MFTWIRLDRRSLYSCLYLRQILSKSCFASWWWLVVVCFDLSLSYTNTTWKLFGHEILGEKNSHTEGFLWLYAVGWLRKLSRADSVSNYNLGILSSIVFLRLLLVFLVSIGYWLDYTMINPGCWFIFNAQFTDKNHLQSSVMFSFPVISR